MVNGTRKTSTLTENTVNTHDDGTMGIRGFARHRDVSPSYIHRLLVEGVIRRNESGRIDVAAADSVLDERRACASPLLLEANAAQRRRRVRTDPAADAGAMIDPVATDEALRWQPAAHTAREPADTPEARIFAGWEARLVNAQTEILCAAFAELRRAGGTAADGEAFRMALGKLWGRLRALVDSERDALERDVAELLADR